MTIEIRDAETVALIRLLAARTGTSDEAAVDAAVTNALASLDTNGTSYREHRNARVRTHALEAQQSGKEQPA